MSNINSWKNCKNDPLPSLYKYPKTNYKSNQNEELGNDYEYYEKICINLSVIFTSSLCVLMKIKKVDTLRKIIFFIFYNTILNGLSFQILKYKYILKKSEFRNAQYPLRIIGYGLQKYISTPSIFKGSLKDKYFPQHKILNDNYEIILSEVTNLLTYVNKIPLTHDAIPYNEYISRDFDKESNRGWKTLALKLEGNITEIGKLHCPKICNIMNIPIIRNATISILEGKRHIPIHCGYFKGYIRYLFCVIEPKSNHSFIYINKEKYIFKANEGILWDDLFPHEVYNMSDDFRVCIYLDIARTFDNKLIDTIFKNVIKLSSFAKAVRKINESYEKKPKALDDFPKYNK